MTELTVPHLSKEDYTTALGIINDGIQINYPYQKLEFVRTKGEVIRNEDGHIVRADVEGSELNAQTLPALRTRGHRRGVLLAFVCPADETKVAIGYSVCHKNDRFDYRRGSHIEGLGTFYALHKADKHIETTRFMISTSPDHRQLPKTVIKIPQTIARDFQNFIYRCSKYYKDKVFPQWAVDFALDGSQPTQLARLNEARILHDSDAPDEAIEDEVA